MLNALKRWISGSSPATDWSSVSIWAQQQGHGFKRARDDEGFVVDGVIDSRPWRLEWGPPQRTYIEGHELRIRMELQLPSDLQMLIISRPLGETLERETFERYTERNQTLIDVSTPEEMRWIAMFPKLVLDLPKDVRAHFGAVASNPVVAAGWVDAPLAEQLRLASAHLLSRQPPFVLMTLRGRLYLRLQLDEPDPDAMRQALALFMTAAHAALQISGIAHETSAEFPNTASTAWQNDIPPDAPHPRNGGGR